MQYWVQIHRWMQYQLPQSETASVRLTQTKILFQMQVKRPISLALAALSMVVTPCISTVASFGTILRDRSDSDDANQANWFPRVRWLNYTTCTHSFLYSGTLVQTRYRLRINLLSALNTVSKILASKFLDTCENLG